MISENSCFNNQEHKRTDWVCEAVGEELARWIIPGSNKQR